MNLLIVEDDIDLNNILCKRLKLSNFNVSQCYDGLEALDYLDEYKYDLIIMDVMMPKLDGFETVKIIRERKINTPVIFLTAKDSDRDIVTGLNNGADDYLVKPFSFEVLLARIKAILRRNDEDKSNIICIKDLYINTNTREVSRGNNHIELSNKEYELLMYLIRNKNTVLSRAQIEEGLYGIDFDNDSNVIDVHIRNLRKKIDSDYEEKLIQTIRSVGYILKV